MPNFSARHRRRLFRRANSDFEPVGPESFLRRGRRRTLRDLAAALAAQVFHPHRSRPVAARSVTRRRSDPCRRRSQLFVPDRVFQEISAGARLAQFPRRLLLALANRRRKHLRGFHSRRSLRPRRARAGNSRWRRLAERRCGAKSSFHFDIPGSAAKSTHAGLPWLRYLRQRLVGRVHFWPFDGWTPPPGRSVIAEVYPRLCALGAAPKISPRISATPTTSRRGYRGRIARAGSPIGSRLP